jgi:hypothetical protein
MNRDRKDYREDGLWSPFRHPSGRGSISVAHPPVNWRAIVSGPYGTSLLTARIFAVLESLFDFDVIEEDVGIRFGARDIVQAKEKHGP